VESDDLRVPQHGPPIIVHDNGRLRVFADRKGFKLNFGPVYCRLLEYEVLRDRELQGQLRRPRDLDIVLCSTRAERQYAERILEALGIDDYVVLGRHLREWNHVCKIQLILDHIISHPQPELLLHLDAPDVLVVGDLKSSVDSFLGGFSCDLLFGAEKGSAPGSRTTDGITDAERQFIESIEDFETQTYDSPFCHLNAGCFIGRKSSIQVLFTEALQTRGSWPLTTVLRHGNKLADDDQLILRELHRTHQNFFAIRRSEIAVDRRVARGPRFLTEYCRHLAFLAMRRVGRRA